MDSGTERDVVEGLFGCGSGLILVELRCLDNHTLCSLSAHLTDIENQIIPIRVAPIRAEHRHEAAAAGLIDLFDILARRDVREILPCPDLFDTKFDWRG